MLGAVGGAERVEPQTNGDNELDAFDMSKSSAIQYVITIQCFFQAWGIAGPNIGPPTPQAWKKQMG